MRKFVRAVLIKDNRVLLIKEKKSLYNAWNFPGGKVENNETPEEAVLREIKEEINMDVKDIDLMFDINCRFSGEDWQGYYFISRNANFDNLKILEATKCQGYCFFEPDELKKMNTAVPKAALKTLINTL